MRRFWLILVALAFLLGALGGPLSLPRAYGQEGFEVVSDSYEYHFGESISFQMRAKSPANIEKIDLIYRVAGTNASNRGTPDFSPGESVDADFTWQMFQGMLPPESDISYHWLLRDGQGRTLQTAEQHFTYHDDRFEWKSLTEGGITIYWYGQNEAFGQRFLGATQKGLEHIEERIGLGFAQTLKVVIYLDKGDMQKALIPRGDTHEYYITTLGVAVSEDTLLLLGTHSAAESTLSHELTHLVVGQATENPFGELPAWLSEGLAVYTEGPSPSHRTALARAVKRGELISLRSLSGRAGRVEEVDLFYAEAFSVVDFLFKTYGQEKMLALLASFKQGIRQEEALEEVYGLTLEEVEHLWRESLGLKGEAIEKELATPSPSRPARPSLCPSLLPGLGLLVLGGVLARRKGRLAL